MAKAGRACRRCGTFDYGYADHNNVGSLPSDVLSLEAPVNPKFVTSVGQLRQHKISGPFVDGLQAPRIEKPSNLICF